MKAWDLTAHSFGNRYAPFALCKNSCLHLVMLLASEKYQITCANQRFDSLKIDITSHYSVHSISSKATCWPDPWQCHSKQICWSSEPQAWSTSGLTFCTIKQNTAAAAIWGQEHSTSRGKEVLPALCPLAGAGCYRTHSCPNTQISSEAELLVSSIPFFEKWSTVNWFLDLELSTTHLPKNAYHYPWLDTLLQQPKTLHPSQCNPAR